MPLSPTEMSDETTCRTCGGEDGFRVTKGGVVVSDEQAAFDKKLMHFIAAVKEGDTGPVSTLLDEIKTPNVADDTGQTALWFAVDTKNLKMVEFLLERGAYCDYEDNAGSRPIVRAIELGDDALPIMKKLLDQKGEGKEVRLHAKQKATGNTLLHRAAWVGWPTMMAELLATGGYTGKLEEMNLQGQTAMHVAAMRSPKAIVQMLKEAGASVTAHEKNGRRLSKETPADIAEAMGRRDNAEYLLSLGGAMNAIKFGAKMRALRGEK